MLNNKGQTLVVFVILLPIFILFIAYIYDTLNINYEKQRLDDIKESLEKSEESDYCDIVYKNDKDMMCNMEQEKIIITKRVKTIFGFINNKKYYEIKTEVKI